MRLDKIPAGSVVTLRFNDSYDERAIFLGIEGEGDDRTAKFVQRDSRESTYDWEAYRYNGHWAYGTGAERLSLIDHQDVLAKGLANPLAI